MSKTSTGSFDGDEASREVLFMDHGPGSLLLEIDGPDVHPENVDTLSLLELAAAFFSIVLAEAAQKGTELHFTGVTVVDKCLRLQAQASDRGVALVAAERTHHVLRGEAVAARGAAQHVDRFHRAARAFDKPGHRLLAMSAGWTLPLEFAPASREPPMDCLLSLRAKPVRAGGAKPAVRFSSSLESDEFTLDSTEDQARELGNQLYREVELEAIIRRGRDGNINGGKVLSYQVVEADCADPWAVWQRWYEEVIRE